MDPARSGVGPPVDLLGVAALVTVLAVVTVVGLVLRARDGRIRQAGTAAGGWGLAGAVPGSGDRVLLLQLSSPVCTPCRRTAELLDELVRRRPGIVHREVDVAQQPDVARTLNVLRTPTVVAFDRAGGELLRVSGVPRATDLETALAPALDPR